MQQTSPDGGPLAAAPAPALQPDAPLQVSLIPVLQIGRAHV